MTTLRRELRSILEKRLEVVFNTAQIPHEAGDLLVDTLIDDILSLRAFKATDEQQPEYKVERGSEEWKEQKRSELEQKNPELALFRTGNTDPALVEIAEKRVHERRAIEAFESAFDIKRPWDWYPDKPGVKQVWDDFRQFVVELYTADSYCFTHYVTWSRQPYSRGTMTALAIKRNPQDFPDSWSSFLASNALYGKKENEPKPQTDASGAPVTY